MATKKKKAAKMSPRIGKMDETKDTNPSAKTASSGTFLHRSGSKAGGKGKAK